MCVSCWDDASHLVRVQESTYESSEGYEMLKWNQEGGIKCQRGHEEGPSIPSGEGVLAKSLMDVVISRVSVQRSGRLCVTISPTSSDSVIEIKTLSYLHLISAHRLPMSIICQQWPAPRCVPSAISSWLTAKSPSPGGGGWPSKDYRGWKTPSKLEGNGRDCGPDHKKLLFQ